MTKERLIWRPNHISVKEWEAMGRDAQIQWWKDQREEYVKPHMKTAIEYYKEGAITETTFCGDVARLAKPEEIEEFVEVCPPALLECLKVYLHDYGPDEREWPRTFQIASCYFPWVSSEEIAEHKRQEQEQIWDGVRLLKEYFNGRASEKVDEAS